MSLDQRQQDHFITLSAALPVLLLLLSGAAHGQTSADLTLTSEYAARGGALNPHPTVQLRVEHELDAGWYGGAFAAPVSLYGDRQAQLTGYLGRAGRFTSTLSWDAGVTATTFGRATRLNYHEFYAGLALDRSSARLFYSPAYYGDDRSAYLDVNTGYPLTDRVSLSLHGGLLHLFGESHKLAETVDLRIALALDVDDYSLKAGWQLKGHDYVPGATRARALSISASRRF